MDHTAMHCGFICIFTAPTLICLLLCSRLIPSCVCHQIKQYTLFACDYLMHSLIYSEFIRFDVKKKKKSKSLWLLTQCLNGDDEKGKMSQRLNKED